jgi:peptidoglycan/LPS O-acetylase OafA/YrhL
MHFVLKSLPACHCLSQFSCSLSGEFRLSKQRQRVCFILGDISFPLYLFHIPTMVLLLSFGVKGSTSMAIGSLLASAVALYGMDYPSRRCFRVGPSRMMKVIPALDPKH